MGTDFDSIAICAIPIRGIKELSVLVLIIFTAYIDIYCGRNQKPVPPILLVGKYPSLRNMGRGENSVELINGIEATEAALHNKVR